MKNELVDAYDVPAKRLLRVADRAAEPVGRFHTWWRGDFLPDLPDLAGLAIEPTNDDRVAALVAIAPNEFRRRTQGSNQFWLARIRDEPVGWGWIASDAVSIGELGIARRLPPGNRYLWDFVTVPRWRGHGIYRWLLQTIVKSGTDAERFWIGHDLPNVASARGIAKAGFHEVGLLYRDQDGGFDLVPTGPIDRASAASALFGVLIAAHLSARPA